MDSNSNHILHNDRDHQVVIVGSPDTPEQIKNGGLLQFKQEAQLSPSDRAMRLVSSNLANYHATVQKLLIRQVLTKLIV